MVCHHDGHSNGHLDKHNRANMTVTFYSQPEEGVELGYKRVRLTQDVHIDPV
jgi:hypothetical protein